MRALIISDSHGLTKELQIIKERHQGEVDLMIHCGDSELEFHSPELEGFKRVGGNCDYDSKFPDEIVEQQGDYIFFVTHGHLYNCKMTLMNLKYKGEEVGANIVCFGHSHVAGAEMIDGILFINPGSIRLPRMRKERTYAIIDRESNNIKVKFFDLDGQMVQSLSTEFSLESQ